MSRQLQLYDHPRKSRAPFQIVDCQSLIAQPGSFCGWLRRKKVFNTWSRRYVVSIRGYVYIFKHEKSSNHSSVFSLQGYTSVESIEDVEGKEPLWIFKIVHSKDSNTKHFSAPNYNDLLLWAKHFDEEIQNINSVDSTPRTPSQTYEVQRYSDQPLSQRVNDDNSTDRANRIRSAESNQLVPVYSGVAKDRDTLSSLLYEEVQPSEDRDRRRNVVLNEQVQPSEDRDRRRNVVLNEQVQPSEDMDRRRNVVLNERRRPLPQVPPEQIKTLPQLPPRSGTGDKRKIGLSTEHYYSCIKDEISDDGDDNDDDDEKYYNIPVNHTYLEPIKTSNEQRKDDTPSYINETSPEKRTTTQSDIVIAVRSYSTKYSNHISFERGSKITVVAKVSDQWMIGEMDGRRGIFPSDHTKPFAVDGYASLAERSTSPLPVYDKLSIEQYIDASSSADITVEEKESPTISLPYPVIAVRAYTAKHPNELSFEQEDKFDVVDSESERWLIGEIEGMKGLFPSEYVKKCTFGVRKTVTTKGQTKEQGIADDDFPYNVIAIQSYEATQETELSFNKDTKFDVIAKISDLCLIGEIHGNRGLFPSKYVKKCNFGNSIKRSVADTNQRSERKSTSEPPFSVIAVKSYQAGANDELTFSKEQKITVLRQETEKWFIGEINGKRGMFPSECVARVTLY